MALRHAEVHQDDPRAVRREHQVGRLHVAMDDPLGVDRLQGQGHVANQGDDLTRIAALVVGG
jgi:hypothetical protein